MDPKMMETKQEAFLNLLKAIKDFRKAGGRIALETMYNYSASSTASIIIADAAVDGDTIKLIQ